MSASKVSVYSDRLRIAGMLYAPEPKGGMPRPAIVMAQGMVGRKELFGFPRIAERFNVLGYIAVTFDYRGVGESEGERGRLIPQELVEDLRNAVTFLEQRPDVDPARIALWGTSFGGAAVPYAAAVDGRVCAAVSIAGFGDGKRWLLGGRTAGQRSVLERRIAADRRQRVLTGKSEFIAPSELFAPDAKSAEVRARVVSAPPGIDARTPPLTLESAERILEFRPASVVERIAPRPLLFVAAKCDTVTPVDGIADLYLLPAMVCRVPTREQTGPHGGPGMPGLLAEVTRLTRWVNYLGVPALVMPCGFDSRGLPIGLQLVARPFAEATLLAAGHAFQRETDWHGRVPAD